jgi:hypothetical protein
MTGAKGRSGRKKSAVPTGPVCFRLPLSDLQQARQFIPNLSKDLQWYVKERIKIGIAAEQKKLQGLLDQKKDIETEYLTRQAALGSMMDQIVVKAKNDEALKVQHQKILDVYQAFLRDNPKYDPSFAYRELSGEIAENSPFEKALLSCLEKNGLPRDLNILRPLIKNPKR